MSQHITSRYSKSHSLEPRKMVQLLSTANLLQRANYRLPHNNWRKPLLIWFYCIEGQTIPKWESPGIDGRGGRGTGGFLLSEGLDSQHPSFLCRLVGRARGEGGGGGGERALLSFLGMMLIIDRRRRQRGRWTDGGSLLSCCHRQRSVTA